MKAALHNLGCKVNAYETEAMEQMLIDDGYEIVPFDEMADVYVINTCSVTHIADRKSRQMIRRARELNPDAVVVACGCYVQTAHDAGTLPEDLGCDIIIGNDKKHELIELLNSALSGGSGSCVHRRSEKRSSTWTHDSLATPETIDGQEKACPDVDDPFEGRRSGHVSTDHPTECIQEISDINEGVHEYEEMASFTPHEHTRAFIKVQDGCNQFCSYCIIPYARGRVRSRSLDSVLAEAHRLAAEGFKEIVITGIHVGSYSWNPAGRDHVSTEDRKNDLLRGHMTHSQPHSEDTASIEIGSDGHVEGRLTSFGGHSIQSQKGNPMDLIDLIEAIAEVDGIERIRLSSIEPRTITEENAKRLAAIEKLCPHFHLSLQSGCDETLKRMNRKYTTEEYRRAVELLRDYFDDPAITTDVIVGFPGETDDEFKKSYDFVKSIGFYELHVFKYSKRSGTRAAKMPDQVSAQDKQKRSDALIALGDKMSEAYRSAHSGRTLSVLIEEYVTLDGADYWTGFSKEYIRVNIPYTDTIHAGDIIDYSIV